MTARSAAALGQGMVTLETATLQVDTDGFSNTISSRGASNLEVTEGHVLGLKATVLNEGTLTLSGAFDVSALTLESTDATHIDTTGQSGDSGFAQAAAHSVTLATGTTANAGASITHGDIRLSLGTDGTATAGGAVDYSTYYLTGTDTASTSAIHGVSANATLSMEGGTLTVDDTATLTATGGALKLEGGALNGSLSGTNLTATSGDINAAFTGNNTITGNDYKQTSVLDNHGTLTLSGSFNVNGLISGDAVPPSGYVGIDGNTSTSGFAVSGERTVTLASGTTVDHGATITDGVFTYQLGTDGTATYGGGTDYGTYHLTGTDAAMTSAIHGVSANATVSMNGGTLTVDDTATVNATGGTLSLEGGTLNGTLSGTGLTATSGDINATFSGNNTITGSNYKLTSVLRNSGTLTLSGTFDVSKLALETTDATHIDTTGQSGDSAFAQAAAHSVTLATGTTANAGASITHGDIRLTLGTDGTATAGGAVDYSTYYLTGTDTASTSAIHGVSANATLSMEGGTLTVDDTATLTATGGALKLEGGTLNGSLSGTNLTATSGDINAAFTGNNTITGNDYKLTSVLDNHGTLTLSGSFNVNGLISGDAVPPSGYVGIDGNTSTSGFAVSGERTVTLASGTTVDHGATITDGVFTYQLGTDGTATYGGGTDYGTYHLTGTDTATTSAIHGASANATVSMNGGTLTVDDAATVYATGGHLSLEGGELNGTIAHASVTAHGGRIRATRLPCWRTVARWCLRAAIHTPAAA